MTCADFLAPTAATERLEVRGYARDPYEHLAVADLAVAQGGLVTTMELRPSESAARPGFRN